MTILPILTGGTLAGAYPAFAANSPASRKWGVKIRGWRSFPPSASSGGSSRLYFLEKAGRREESPGVS
jgi:hypothetical protein